LEPNPAEEMKSLDSQSKTPIDSPNLDLRTAIFTLPIWWFIIFVAVSTRVAHFFNNRSLLHEELATIVILVVPFFVFVFLWARSTWFRKKAVVIFFIWLFTPLAIQQLGMTQGTFFRLFGDPWAFEHP
jgi:hypothetical protein